MVSAVKRAGFSPNDNQNLVGPSPPSFLKSGTYIFQKRPKCIFKGGYWYSNRYPKVGMYSDLSKITWNFQLRNQPSRWERGEKVDVIILKQLFKLRRFGANPFITTTYISVFTQQFIASWWKSKDVLSCFIISRSWPRFDFKKWGKCF